MEGRRRAYTTTIIFDEVLYSFQRFREIDGWIERVSFPEPEERREFN